MLECGATLDSRDSQIELEAFGLARQGKSDRMKERLPFLPRLLPHACRGGAESLAIEERSTCVELGGKCIDHGPRAAGFVANLRNLQRPFRGIVEQEGQPPRHLFQAID